MSRRTITMITGCVLLVALGIGSIRLPVPYVRLGPGPTYDTLGTDDAGKEIIGIDGRDERQTSGHLNLTTISVRGGPGDNLDLLTALGGWLDPRFSVVPREEIYPPGKSAQEVDKETTKEFTESQSSAEFVALGELGYPPQVVVQDVPAGSPSAGKLAPKDELVSVNGQRVREYSDISKVLTALSPGATVEVGYRRDGKTGTARIVTTKASDRKGAAVGIVLTLRRDAPFTVTIGLNESIGGPSAGLMFALGIMDKVGPEELTGGKFIAGTGTIDFSGNVGPIGGIQLKMISAREHGATVFLVPKDNCTDALQRPPAGLQLVKVETLRGALEALQDIRAGQPAPTCEAP
jgi:PDZ domain-containing protein